MPHRKTVKTFEPSTFGSVSVHLCCGITRDFPIRNFLNEPKAQNQAPPGKRVAQWTKSELQLPVTVQSRSGDRPCAAEPACFVPMWKIEENNTPAPIMRTSFCERDSSDEISDFARGVETSRVFPFLPWTKRGLWWRGSTLCTAWKSRPQHPLRYAAPFALFWVRLIFGNLQRTLFHMFCVFAQAWYFFKAKEETQEAQKEKGRHGRNLTVFRFKWKKIPKIPRPQSEITQQHQFSSVVWQIHLFEHFKYKTAYEKSCF